MATTEEYSDFEAFWDALKNENLTEEEYLNRILGPKYLPSRLVIPLTLAYVIIFVSGVVGNIATCIVIIKNTSMHTSTNYYLFNLAISDLILLVVGLPNELSSVWQQYPWALGVVLCKLRAYVSEMSSYVSVITIVAFSMERYLAICHPLRTYTANGAQRPILIILGAWCIALICAIPFVIYTNVNYVEYPPDSGRDSVESAICAMLLPEMPEFPLYELSCFVFFLIPMFVIFGVYIRMGLTIRNSAKTSDQSMNESSAHWDNRRVQSRKSIIKMLSAVVVMFFFCWAPFHAQRLFYVYAQEADYYPDLNEWLYVLSGVLYYFSTTVNPILYNLMSYRYRKAFKTTMCCRKLRPSQGVRSFRCDSEILPTSHFRSAVKNTIDQAKGIFKIRSNRHEHREIRSPADGPKINVDLTTKPLMGTTRPKVSQQLSTDSTTIATNTMNESMLTDTSFV